MEDENKIRPIFSPDFWRQRIDDLRGTRWSKEVHRSVYNCTKEVWVDIENRHKEILSQHIREEDSVLDVGCAYGRILDLMPHTWKGSYLGIDLSPDFIEIAREQYRGRGFLAMDARDLSTLRNFAADNGMFNWAVFGGFRPMIIRNAGQETWDAIEHQVRNCCERLLFLEYDPLYQGIVEL